MRKWCGNCRKFFVEVVFNLEVNTFIYEIYTLIPRSVTFSSNISRPVITSLLRVIYTKLMVSLLLINIRFCNIRRQWWIRDSYFIRTPSHYDDFIVLLLRYKWWLTPFLLINTRTCGGGIYCPALKPWKLATCGVPGGPKSPRLNKMGLMDNDLIYIS